MKITPLPLKDAALVQFSSFGDNRGSFTRVFCADTLAEATMFKSPVRHVNHSITAKAGTIRGLHYQAAPALEAKLVRCIRGRAFDVMIDMRKGSPSFLQVFTVTLDGPGTAVFVPEGFAHGFQTLEDDTEIMYMTTHPYAKEHEGAVRWDDPKFGIKWPMQPTELSDRDKVIPDVPGDFEGI